MTLLDCYLYLNLHTRQIRETVGPENIDVYRNVLSLLRECAEEGDPVKLFHQLKRVLGEKWPQLLEEFVPFLRPEQVKTKKPMSIDL